MSNSKFGCQDPILKKNDSKLAGFFVEKETNILVFAELSNGTAYIGIVNKDDKEDSQSTKPLRQFLYEYDLLDIKDSFWMPRKKDGHSHLVDFKACASPFNNSDSSSFDDGFDVVRGIFNDKVGYQDIPLTVLLSDYECISFNRCPRLNAEHYVANMDADIYDRTPQSYKSSTDYEKYKKHTEAAIGFGDIFELAGSKWVDDKGAHKAKASLTLFGLVFSVNTSLTANQLDIDLNLDNKGA